MTSWQIAKTIGLVLDSLGELDDPVPEPLRRQEGLMTMRAALEGVHRPEDEGRIPDAVRTLRWHEALILQTALLQQRQLVRAMAATPRPAGELRAAFDRGLPFTLTPDQAEVGDRVAADLIGAWPMNRLVQGEVGSGKTLVALRAMLQVAESGGQSALIAPTEVLAAQHLRSIAAMLGPDLAPRLMPTLLTGQMAAADRRKRLFASRRGRRSS